MSYFRRVVRDDRAFLFAVPNGEKRDKITAGILIGMGVEAGVSDLILLGADRLVVLIETKRPETLVMNLERGKMERLPAGDLSPRQEAFRDRVTRYGFPYRTYTTLDEFIAILAEFGVVRRLPSGVAV